MMTSILYVNIFSYMLIIVDSLAYGATNYGFLKKERAPVANQETR